LKSVLLLNILPVLVCGYKDNKKDLYTAKKIFP